MILSNRRHHFLELLGRNSDRAVQRDSGAGEERGEQVALIALGFGEEASRVQRPPRPVRQ